MFSVEKTDLFNILKRTKGVLIKHSIQPVLVCYKIDVANNAIKVTATDLDNQISGSCVARTEEDLSFCVDGFKFTEIVNILDGIITFEVEDGKLLIKCGRTKYKMLMLEADEFPKDMTDFEYTSTELPKTFISKVKQTIFCTSTVDSRNVISGVCFDIDDCKLNLVATDGNRLSVATVDVENIENNRFVVPQRILGELIKSEYDSIFIGFGENKVMFIADNMMFVTKIINGEYPQYKQLLPKSFSGITKLDKNEFKDALSRTCIMINEKTQRVTFKINKNSVRMCSENADFGTSSDCIDVLTSTIDEELTICFNSNYINDYLNNSKEDEIKFCTNGANSATMIQGDFDYLVMPLKV